MFAKTGSRIIQGNSGNSCDSKKNNFMPASQYNSDSKKLALGLGMEAGPVKALQEMASSASKEKNVKEIAANQRKTPVKQVRGLGTAELGEKSPFYPADAVARSGTMLDLTPVKESTQKMLSGFENLSRAHTILNQHLSSAAATSVELVNPQCSRLLAPDQSLVRKLLAEEKDERYRYLLRHGNLHHIEADSYSIYVELPQIPNILIIYRRPSERDAHPEKMCLDSRGLKHIPLLEGEEKVKYLNLQNNQIGKIENLVSLPNLHFLDLSSNKLAEINNFPTAVHLRCLILSMNTIPKI